MNFINLNMSKVRERVISKVMVKLGIMETLNMVTNIHNQMNWETLIERICNEGNWIE